jgi:predicted helicase
LFQINKKKGWSIRKAWNMLQSVPDSDLDKFVLPILYRPFDIQWIFYHDSVVWRTVKRIMCYMMKENLALCVGRAGQVVGIDMLWNIIFCSTYIEDFNLFYRGGNVNLPLYIYPNSEEKEILQKQPNINSKIFSTLSDAYKREPTPEEILYYIYSVLYSNTYRTKYAEFLRIDFPRVPFTKDYELFILMGSYGKRLTDLHLLESSELDTPIARFDGEGDGKVEKLRYDEEQGRVYINSEQYFEGVIKEIWEYHVGGYQVCQKWLKDRKNRELSLDEIKQYCKIVTALQKTMEIQKLIDAVYPEVEKDIIEF